MPLPTQISKPKKVPSGVNLSEKTWCIIDDYAVLLSSEYGKANRGDAITAGFDALIKAGWSPGKKLKVVK